MKDQLQSHVGVQKKELKRASCPSPSNQREAVSDGVVQRWETGRRDSRNRRNSSQPQPERMTRPQQHAIPCAPIPLQEITDLVSLELAVNLYQRTDIHSILLLGRMARSICHHHAGDQALGLSVSLFRIWWVGINYPGPSPTEWETAFQKQSRSPSRAKQRTGRGSCLALCCQISLCWAQVTLHRDQS